MLHNAFTKLCVSVCLLGGLCSAAVPPVVSDQRYLEDIKTLTQPAMEGRGDGTKGLEDAAKFLADNYKKFGLKPAGTNGYFQPFTVTTGARLQPKNRLDVTTSGSSSSLKLNADYVPLNFYAVG